MGVFKDKYINIMTWGGLGDALLATPSFKALKEQYSHKKIRVFYLARHKDIYVNNPHIDILQEASFRGSPWSWIKFYFGFLKINTFDYSFTKPTKNYDKSIISVVADVLETEVDDGVNMEIYLSEDEKQRGIDLLKKFQTKIIIIAPHTTSSENKLWFHENWLELIDVMPDYTFIQLGLKKEPKIEGAVDFRGLSIRDSMAVVSKADCFVGVDSFFSHVATALKIPSVVLFGATPPSIFGHDQNTNLYAKTSCSPCYEYLIDSVCPYSRKCMMGLEVSDVKSKIEQQVNC